MSDVAPWVLLVPLGGIGGGGGASNFGRGGGGGGAGADDDGGLMTAFDEGWPDCTCRRASCGSIPSLLFHVTPVG